MESQKPDKQRLRDSESLLECLGEDRVFGAGVGTKAYEPKIICLDNKKIAIFGVGEGGFGVNKEKNGGGMHGLKIKDSFIQC